VKNKQLIEELSKFSPEQEVGLVANFVVCGCRINQNCYCAASPHKFHITHVIEQFKREFKLKDIFIFGQEDFSS